jgi:hypothetical protein
MMASAAQIFITVYLSKMAMNGLIGRSSGKAGMVHVCAVPFLGQIRQFIAMNSHPSGPQKTARATLTIESPLDRQGNRAPLLRNAVTGCERLRSPLQSGTA